MSARVPRPCSACGADVFIPADTAAEMDAILEANPDAPFYTLCDIHTPPRDHPGVVGGWTWDDAEGDES